VLALGEKLEIVEQRLHRRIEAVAVAQLQGEAFLEAAREYSGGIKALQQEEGLLDPLRFAAQPFGGRGDVAGEPAGVIELVDKL
jgi:hypothetical protein